MKLKRHPGPFSDAEAREISQRLGGPSIIAVRRDGQHQVGELVALADFRVYGRGRSFNEALENAGIDLDILFIDESK